MVSAYILVTTKSGAEKDVLTALKKVPNMKNARMLYGEYDIIAKIQLTDIATLNEYLLANIRPISGVERTSTLIVAN